MRTLDWAKSLSSHPYIAGLITPFDASVEWHAVASEARPVLIAAAYLANPRKILVVTANYELNCTRELYIPMPSTPQKPYRGKLLMRCDE